MVNQRRQAAANAVANEETRSLITRLENSYEIEFSDAQKEKIRRFPNLREKLTMEMGSLAGMIQPTYWNN